MAVQFLRFIQLLLVIVVALLLAGCTTTPRSGLPTPAAATTGCPDALGPVPAPIVAAAGNNLVAIDEDGRGQSWLLSLSTDASAAFPAWSPDGETLAYALRYPTPAPKRRGIISVICGLDRATGKGRLLAAGIEDDWLDEPVWTPDGQSLLLTLNRFQVGADQQAVDMRNVARYDLANAALQILVPEAHSPAPSASGDRLVYVAAEPQSQTEVLFVAGPDGQNPQQLITLEQPYVSAMWPRWSPDDTQILFGVGLVVGEEDERYVPCVVGTNGQGFEQLGQNANNVVSVAWGPDSRRIAYVTSGTGLFIYDMGRDQVRNVMRAGDGMGVAWARD